MSLKYWRGQLTKYYTDGACSGNPGYGGWAALSCGTGELISGNHYPATNNQMEMFAILMAIQMALKDEKVVILTDSIISINWLAKGFKANKDYISDIRKAYTDVVYAMKLDVSFIKVKGHSNDRYNNIVDRAASGEAKMRKKKEASS